VIGYLFDDTIAVDLSFAAICLSGAVAWALLDQLFARSTNCLIDLFSISTGWNAEWDQAWLCQ